MYALVSHLESQFGVHYAIGGVAAMAQAMADVIRDQGGMLRMETDVDEILIRDHRATGVRLASGETIGSGPQWVPKRNSTGLTKRKNRNVS